jgi:hypothetical protein
MSENGLLNEFENEVGVLQKNYSKLRALLKKETLTQQAM